MSNGSFKIAGTDFKFQRCDTLTCYKYCFPVQMPRICQFWKLHYPTHKDDRIETVQRRFLRLVLYLIISGYTCHSRDLQTQLQGYVLSRFSMHKLLNNLTDATDIVNSTTFQIPQYLSLRSFFPVTLLMICAVTKSRSCGI